MQELATSLRTWRRHFARAHEVDASLPNGVLLLKALEDAVQKIAKEDAQASFRLSTSRQQLALDERPTEQSIWSFSQCLLAEAEIEFAEGVCYEISSGKHPSEAQTDGCCSWFGLASKEQHS